MKIRDKHAVKGYRSVTGYTKTRLLSLFNNAGNRGVKPLEDDKQYVFICGCGHSGTTLLASRLGNHPDAMLIGRETGVFNYPSGLFSAKQVVKDWSYFASVKKKQFIIEKTPKHIHSIDRILKVLPNARFIIMVRNPLDNIASIYKRFGDLNVAVERWNTDNKSVAKMKSLNNVAVVSYEGLTSSPNSVLIELQRFAGMKAFDGLDQQLDSAYSFTRQAGNMKIREEQVSQAIISKNGKARNVLEILDIEYIKNSTKNIAQDLGYFVKY